MTLKHLEKDLAYDPDTLIYADDSVHLVISQLNTLLTSIFITASRMFSMNVF